MENNESTASEQWYAAAFITHQQPSTRDGTLFLCREYWCLLTSKSSNSAYVSAQAAARTFVTPLNAENPGGWVLDGISDLLMMADPPADGTELVWAQTESPQSDLHNLVKGREDLSAFVAARHGDLNHSGWYVAKIVLIERHDTGSHGDSLLVWTNWHLIRTACLESAYDFAEEIGKAQSSEPHSHHCDGDGAHWEFLGIRDLIETLGSPQAGRVLWVEEFYVHRDQLAKLTPPRSELSVFDWERRRGEGRDLWAGGSIS